MSEYDQLIVEIESDLWAAMAALEQQDLIAVRQCVIRANQQTVAAWQAFRRETGEVDNGCS